MKQNWMGDPLPSAIMHTWLGGGRPAPTIPQTCAQSGWAPSIFFTS